MIHVETQKLSLTPKGCGAHGCGIWIVICHNIVSIIIDKCCKNTNYYYQSITFQEKNVIKSILNKKKPIKNLVFDALSM